MKRMAALVLACLLALSCARAKADQTAEADPADVTVDRIARYIVGTGCGLDPAGLERLDETLDADALDRYITGIYGLEEGSWTSCALYRAGGAEALEIAVFRMADPGAAGTAAEALTAYIQAREGDFTGYEPEQAAIVHDSLAAASEQGDAALLICPDAGRARDAFLASYEALYRCPFDPPNADDMTIYDTAAILEAWESGDASGLTDKDAAILEKAAQVLEDVTEDDMDPLDVERAVYRWITSTVTYDQDHYDKTVTMSPDSFSPYGPLIEGKGVCLGVASTFQLLMDMAGVECITVVGASYSSARDHAWNMVRLDGRWYCADPTWDLGDAEETWAYFNVTSDHLAATDHQWDYANVPEAVDAAPVPAGPGADGEG